MTDFADKPTSAKHKARKMATFFSLQCFTTAVAVLAVASSHTSVAPPNFIIILTDDQDLLLDSMQALPFTVQKLGKGGATFDRFHAHTPGASSQPHPHSALCFYLFLSPPFIQHPPFLSNIHTCSVRLERIDESTYHQVCCPSRAEFLSGRYFHTIKNARPLDEKLSCMHVNTDDAFQNQMVFARALNELGYATGYFGKYFNEGGMERLCPTSGDTPAPLAPPQGWSSDADAWVVMCPDTCCECCVGGFIRSKVPHRSRHHPIITVIPPLLLPFLIFPLLS